MKPEMSNKLYKKYPKLFIQKDKSLTETAMCWGLQCDSGWYWLLDQLCFCIQAYVTNNKKAQVEFTTVKEKFGTLRVYASNSNEMVEGMIWLAEQMSGSICEQCGSTDGVSQTKGWIVTLCKPCMSKRNDRGMDENNGVRTRTRKKKGNGLQDHKK